MWCRSRSRDCCERRGSMLRPVERARDRIRIPALLALGNPWKCSQKNDILSESPFPAINTHFVRVCRHVVDRFRIDRLRVAFFVARRAKADDRVGMRGS